MRVFIFSVLAVFSVILKAQTDTFPDLKDVQLDVLKTPGNPAFTIMSTSPSEVNEPASLTDFYISIQNASSNFSSLPNNYGFTVTPFWWTKAAKSMSFENDYSTSNKLYFWRYLRLSAGIVKGINDQENMWRYGLGFQTNLYSGKVDKVKKEEYLNALRIYNRKFFKSLQDYFIKDTLYVQLVAEQNNLLKKMQAAGTTDTTVLKEYKKLIAQKQHLETILSKQFDLLQNNKEDFPDANAAFTELEKRIGFKWDVGAGISCDIENHKIDSADINKSGIWTNFGWVMPVNNSGLFLSTLGLVRFLNYEDVEYVYDNNFFYSKFLGILDFGFQVKIELNSKFSALIEGVYRSYFDDRMKSTYKLNGLLQYRFNKNQLVFCSFGNAFNNHNDEGPKDIQLNIGLNLGISDNVNIKFR